MANTLVGASGAQRGCELAETGINLDSFSCRYYPQFKDFLQNYLGQNYGFAVPAKFSRKLTIKGETTGNTGIMAIAIATVVTVANDVSTFGDGTGGFYLDDATESQSRTGWRTVDVSLTSDPLIT